MIYQYDWLMRQIEMAAAFIWFVLSGKTAETDTPEEIRTKAAQTNSLFLRLLAMVNQGKICEAEDELFIAVQDGEERTLEAAVLFYTEVNKLSDKALEEINFSREEIFEGLKEICNIYGIQSDLLY